MDPKNIPSVSQEHRRAGAAPAEHVLRLPDVHLQHLSPPEGCGGILGTLSHPAFFPKYEMASSMIPVCVGETNGSDPFFWGVVSMFGRSEGAEKLFSAKWKVRVYGTEQIAGPFQTLGIS